MILGLFIGKCFWAGYQSGRLLDLRLERPAKGPEVFISSLLPRMVYDTRSRLCRRRGGKRRVQRSEGEESDIFTFLAVPKVKH